MGICGSNNSRDFTSMASPTESKPQIQTSMASSTAESKPQHLPLPPDNVSNANSHQRIKDEPSDVLEEKPIAVDNIIRNMEKEQAETLKKYEAEFTSYLKAKYFSDKDIYGDDIFEKKNVVDGKTIKEGRFPGTKSYADPAGFKEESSSAVRPPANVSNGNHSAK